MSLVNVIDLCGDDDDELEELDVKPIKVEPSLGAVTVHQNSYASQVKHPHPTSKKVLTKQGSEEVGSLNTSRSNSGTPTSILDLGTTRLVDYASLPSPTTISPAPLCRQFWKAGNYNDIPAPRANYQNGKNYLKVHPMFLHSNATSHKWAFGAVAELLDNAIDEIQNGASFVSVDKITNPRNGNSALLFQDDGGGMSPEAMRRCMSFGFTDKKAKSAIGRYGNGFKTSTMRLGADVIVLTRHLEDSVMTQSAGLLSYTFLSEMRYDRIVVPMVHFQYNTYSGDLDFLHGREHFKSNLSLILKWSPYSTETELLKQFDDIGTHGTKVVVYNLWHTDDGSEELDCETDVKDICIHGETKKADTRPGWNAVNEQHIGYRYRHSLRAYLSILYLRIPESFKIILRGEVVERHNLADDLQHLKYILYKPKTGNGREAQVITTIGFLKKAPQVNLHGFNVYHKNRLILPFWQVVNYLDSRGRGVVGVLEANFVEPTHNKQEFEKTSLFQKLESRLKEMTFEYWDIHCGLLGYQVKVKPKEGMTSLVSSSQVPAELRSNSHIVAPVGFGNATRKRSERPISDPVQGSHLNRKEHVSENTERAKRQALVGYDVTTTGQELASQRTDQEAIDVQNENKKLRLNCLEYEKDETELELKVARIKNEIKEMEEKYSRLLSEFSAMNTAKEESA